MNLTFHFLTHPCEDVLEAYAFNRLLEDQLSAVEMHLLMCAVCQQTLKTLDDFISFIKGVPAEPLHKRLSSPESGRRRLRRYAC